MIYPVQIVNVTCERRADDTYRILQNDPKQFEENQQIVVCTSHQEYTSYSARMANFFVKRFVRLINTGLYYSRPDLVDKFDNILNELMLEFGYSEKIAKHCDSYKFDLYEKHYVLKVPPKVSYTAEFSTENRKYYSLIEFTINLGREERKPTLLDKIKRMLHGERGYYVSRPIVTYYYSPEIRIYESPSSYYCLTFTPILLDLSGQRYRLDEKIDEQFRMEQMSNKKGSQDESRRRNAFTAAIAQGL